MRCCTLLFLAGGFFLTVSVVRPQESKEQEEILAMLAKLDGKVKFDVTHPKRVVGIDV